MTNVAHCISERQCHWHCATLLGCRQLPCMHPTNMWCGGPCLSTCRSKADEVTDERDRQRVLIQITQNLATRIRNSHAFNLPTFYLPHEDDGGLPCSIPNAIDDVCEEIDKVGWCCCEQTSCNVWLAAGAGSGKLQL